MKAQIRATLLLAVAACGSNQSQAAPDRGPGKLEPIGGLCVTKGSAAIGSAVTEPTMRAVALESQGDAASMTFTYRGFTEKTRELASGQERRQLGLKLRAVNGCNLVYVMWRMDPAPRIDVSVKLNPGSRTHSDCGAGGYTKVKASSGEKLALVPVLAAGDTHTLRAAIFASAGGGDELRAWIDDKLVYRGTLPDSARDLVGPAGVRSDNLRFDLVSFAAPKGDAKVAPKCKTEEGD